ncbi:sugar phosphate isomerase/epimerase family protein [Streptomyces sp. NPDC058770]|uniref:sugar phosphate isomerase/epimerase family protein n=1 Tax=Streptomyces sp. NPDC058770 TaxID=3346631 RepID=UPI0036B1A2CC
MSRRTPADPELARRLGRRSVLGVAAGATAAALLGAGAPGAAALDKPHADPLMPPGRLGIQLYTLRDKVATLGFAKVFAELAAYGYDEVEYAGYTQGSAGAITLAQLRRLAHDYGLRGIGSHVGYHDDNNPKAYTFAQNLTKVLDDAQALGLTHIGTASGPFRYGSTVDAWKRAAEDFNTYGAAARARGMKFYQHNHAEEFSFATDRPDVRLYDVLLAETDPDLVFLEMDIYWAHVGRFRFGKRPDGTPAPFDPLGYVLKQPGRYPLFHVKDGEHDEAARDGYRMVDVGDGDIDYQRFLDAVTRTLPQALGSARAGGTPSGRRDHHWQVEHDHPIIDSFTTARRSAAHLHSLRRKGC